MSRRSSKKRSARKLNFAGWVRDQFAPPVCPRLVARRLQFEYLEPRQMLSVAQPAGPVFEVDPGLGDDQADARIATDASGDFVIVWQSYLQAVIVGQRYNSSGVAQGSEFQVTANNAFLIRENPAVAMDASGDFVVVWDDQPGIFAQRYDAAGDALGSNFQVVTSTSTGAPSNPSVAMDSAGDFVVAWEGGPGGPGIVAQRYNAAGTAQGSNFEVDTVFGGGMQSVAMDSAGDFVVAWEGYDSASSVEAIYAQRYDAGGVAQGSNFQVNSYTSESQFSAMVAMDSVGDFIIAWQGGVVDSPYDIYAQRYNSSGLAQGSEFQVNTYTAGDLGDASVSMDPAGDFVISWTDQYDGLSDSFYDIYSRLYDTAGNPLGSEFAVEALTSNVEGSPAVELDAAGDLVVAWEQYDENSGAYSIYAQRYMVSKAATHLVVTTQPPATVTAGSGFGLTVTVEDDFNAPVAGFSGTVTVALAGNPGSSTLTGTLTATAVNGVATFSGLTLNKAASGYTLLLTSDTLTSATTDNIQVVPGAVAQLAIASPFPTNVTEGALFGFTAAAEDAEGNLVSSFVGSASVAISTNPGSSTLGGTTTATAAGGLAVFSGLTLNNLGAGYQLSVTSSGLSAAAIGPFNVTALGVATHLAIATSLPATVAPGTAFGATVEAEDDFGMVDTSFTGGVTIALASSPGVGTLSGTLSGTLTAAASAGVASFAGLSLDKPGSYTLQATSSGLTTGTTNPFNVVGTLTINGSSTSNSVQVTFIDATDFQVVVNGAAPATYSTTAAKKVVYNGPSGTFSELIFDDPSNTYTATQTFASTDLVDGGFEFDANNVADLYIYAANGKSTATVTVDSGTDSNFYVGDTASDYSYIGDPAQGLYSELSGFGSETIAGSAGTTYAYVYSTTNASIVAGPAQTTFTGADVMGSLSDFPQVYVVGAADGTDSVTLDSSGGTFVGTPQFSYVTGTDSGATFLLGALYAAQVTGDAAGTSDTAVFYSYSSNTFNGAPGTTSALTGSTTNVAGSSINFVSQVSGYNSVAVFESGYESDEANLTSPGNGSFFGTDTASTLTVGTGTITVNSYLVNSSQAIVPVPAQIAVTGSGNGTDSADIFDAPGNSFDALGSNFLSAVNGTATLVSAYGTLTINNFGSVTANQQNGTDDTVHEGSIDFALITVGNWTSD